MSREGTKFLSLPGMDIFKQKKERERVINLLEEAHLLKSDIDRKTIRLDEIKDELLIIQQEQGVDGFRNGEFTFAASWVEGRTSLNKDMLVENGCDPQIIAQSYKKGEGYWKKDLKRLELE